MTAEDMSGQTQANPSPPRIPEAQQDDETDSVYHLKWIQWNQDRIPIVMQSKNGPCPLIAIMNVLFLREKIRLPSMLEQITANQLLTYLAECIMDSVPASDDSDENTLLNIEQNIHDTIEVLPNLSTGMDVNMRFNGITDFEFTSQCIIFDILRIPLYHGWLCDPALVEIQNAIGNQSYNQLVDFIITNATSTDPDVETRVMLVEEFLSRTASQLTEHGLLQLRAQIKDNEIGVLFRNNHFLTMFKRDGNVYTLVTDHGYLTEENIIWELLDSIEGAGCYYDSDFRLPEASKKQIEAYKDMRNADHDPNTINDFSRDETLHLAASTAQDEWIGAPPSEFLTSGPEPVSNTAPIPDPPPDPGVSASSSSIPLYAWSTVDPREPRPVNEPQRNEEWAHQEFPCTQSDSLRAGPELPRQHELQPHLAPSVPAEQQSQANRDEVSSSSQDNGNRSAPARQRSAIINLLQRMRM